MGMLFSRKKQYDESLPADTLLAFRAADGDEGAFSEIVTKYERLVSTCVFSVCADREDTLDISQEVFFKVYRNLSSFKGESEFSTWIYRVAKNCALDFVRKKRVAVTSIDSSGEEGEGFDIPDESPKNSPEAMVLEGEKSEILKKALDKLSDEHREIIILRDINEYSYEKISGMLEIEQGTVKSRIFRAREALKKILLKENYFVGTF